MSIKNNYIFWIIVVCISIFFTNLDAIIVNIMEARNFITAREMIQYDNWILTTLNGEPRYQKPPLPTWLTAFSAFIFGFKNIIALRIPAALITTMLIVYFFKLGEKMTLNKKYAFISSLILATSFFIIFSGRNAQWDIFTHGFMIVCIYQLFLLFSEDNKKYHRAIYAAIFFGFSFMSKGPVSLYALLFPFIIAYGISYKFNSLKSRIVPLILFIIIGIIISGWWHLYTYYFDPSNVLEITKKESNNWSSYEVKPFYYYWSFFTQSGVWTIPAFISLLYPYLKNKVSNKKAYQFSFIWTISSVILLSIIPEKKSRYLLPVLIPLALNTGFYIEYLILRFKDLKDKRETVPVYFNFGLIALIGILFPVGGYLFLKDSISGYFHWYLLLSIALFCIGILIFKFLKLKNIEKVFYLTISFIISVMIFGMPLAKTFYNNPNYYSISNLNTWQLKTNLEVYEYEGFCPEMIFEFGKPIKAITKNNAVIIPEKESFGVLVSLNQKEKFENTFKNYSIEKIERYDMNQGKPGSRSHRPRLWRDFYLVTKK